MNLARTRLILYRGGLSVCCAVGILIYLIGCVIVDRHLPADKAVLRMPLLNSTFLILFIGCSYYFLAVHYYKKNPVWKTYPYVFGSTVICYLLFSSFCYGKFAIPLVVPYYMDPLLQRIDIALHFGRSPFEWLWPLMTPQLVSLLDMVYGEFWFSAMYLYVFWQLFTVREPGGRIRFISTFLMSWLLMGNGLALLLSSAGPTYYSLFYHDQYSAMNTALVQKLYAVNATYPLVDAVGAREMLLGWYHDTTRMHPNVMSAMPSMHVGAAFLMALHSWRYMRPLAWLTLPFTVLIMLGSVVLGWHYAIDGYVAMLVTLLFWWMNGWELTRYHRLDAA